MTNYWDYRWISPPYKKHAYSVQARWRRETTPSWQGKSTEERREHGVGFAVRNSLLSVVEPGDKGSERLLTLRLQTSDGPVTFVSAYAPTLTSTPEAKDEFYTNLSDVIKNIPDNEHLVLLGDFNARVGALAPAGPGHCQTNKPQDCASHSLTPQRRLRHRPLTSVQQIQTSPEEVPSYKDSGEAAHRHHKDAASGYTPFIKVL